MTLLVALGKEGMQVLRILDALLAMAVTPGLVPRPRFVALTGEGVDFDFPGPVQRLGTNPDGPWWAGPWVTHVPGDSGLQGTLAREDAYWRRILSVGEGVVHLVSCSSAPEAVLHDMLRDWATEASRDVASTWVGEGEKAGRRTPDVSAAASLLLRDLLATPEVPVPCGSWRGVISGHDRERVQAILESRLLKDLLEQNPTDEVSFPAGLWARVDVPESAEADLETLARAMQEAGPVRGESLRSWLLAELEVRRSVLEPGWSPPDSLRRAQVDTLREGLQAELWSSGQGRPGAGIVAHWLSVLEHLHAGLIERHQASLEREAALREALDRSEGEVSQALESLKPGRSRFLGLPAPLAAEEVLRVTSRITPWWRDLSELQTMKIRRVCLEDLQDQVARMIRTLGTWHTLVEREAGRRLAHLGPVLAREALPGMEHEHEHAVEDALVWLAAHHPEALLEAAGGPGWVQRLVGEEALPVVPQVADLMGALTARAVRATAMSATAPAGQRSRSRSARGLYDPDLHPFTGHGGRALRPGWQLLWGGRPDSPAPGVDPEVAVTVFIALALGGLCWRGGAFRLLGEDERWVAVAAGREPWRLPEQLRTNPAWLARTRSLAERGLQHREGEAGRQQARQLARLLHALQAPGLPGAWAATMWARLDRLGWTARVLAESEAARTSCPSCLAPAPKGRCKTCGPVHGTWWAV
ncbi:MAG: hypothetical protein VKO21_03595 [Candidatus Sericytochromatia bacterium]|nr:hypothetical protein [Candidatus Sericytochromatia bacterium]